MLLRFSRILASSRERMKSDLFVGQASRLLIFRLAGGAPALQFLVSWLPDLSLVVLLSDFPDSFLICANLRNLRTE